MQGDHTVYQKGSPHIVELEAGKTVYICRCGQTGTPPFCDGTHKTLTGVTPQEHTVASDGKVYVCGCGRSGNLPFCDGSHKQA
jgi:CDGSH-type Zn-finger protein